MFRPVEMMKIRVIGLRKDLEAMIKLLHETGYLEFTRYKNGLERQTPLASYSQITEQLVRLRAIEKALPPQSKTKKLKEIGLGTLLDGINGVNIDARLKELREKLDKIEEELREFAKVQRLLKSFEGIDLGALSIKSKSVHIFMGRIPSTKVMRLEGKIAEITKNFLLISKPLNRSESMCLMAVDKRRLSDVRDMLSKGGFAEEKLPELPETKTPGKMLQDIEKRLSLLEAERKKNEEELHKLSREYWDRVVCYREMLEIYQQRAEAPSNFAGTKSAVIFEGWIPKDKREEVKALFAERFGAALVLQEIKTDEMPPTLLRNPPFLLPFEFLLRFVSLPKATEIDPTFLLAFIFPIIYGMMLGDAGYGLASLGISLLVIKKTKPDSMLNPIGKVWAIASVPAIFFGILYDEFFGFTHRELLGYSLYTPIGRMENIPLLILASVLFGFALIGFGFLLSAAVKFQKGDIKHGIAKLAFIGVEVSGIVLVSTLMFNVFPGWVVLPMATLLFLSVIPIAMVEGIVGLIEIPSVAANAFSYARIVAVGIASVIVALIINDLLKPDPSSGLLFFVMAPIFLFLHLFNIMLGMFESLVQGARLNFIEFFSKFYDGGGRPFSPFFYVKEHIL